MDESSDRDRPPAEATALASEGRRHALLTKVLSRKAALENVLQLIEARAPGGQGGAKRANEFGQALAVVDSLLKGDLDDLSPAIRTRLSQWLRSSDELLTRQTTVAEPLP